MCTWNGSKLPKKAETRLSGEHHFFPSTYPSKSTQFVHVSTLFLYITKNISSLSFCKITSRSTHRNMGGCFSCRSSFTFNTVRVVHLNGFVEYFEGPISVSQITGGSGNPSKHFVCTPLQLLSPSSKPLKKETWLQPGQVYFMLPFSILQSDASSPVDMASLAKRLTKKAEIKPCSDKSSSIGWSSPSSSPGRVGVADQIGVSYGGGRSPCRMKPWKPILDTIKEKSFNRRESDLQENN